jgi:hypothetical protein
MTNAEPETSYGWCGCGDELLKAGETECGICQSIDREQAEPAQTCPKCRGSGYSDSIGSGEHLQRVPCDACQPALAARKKPDATVPPTE